RPPGRHRREDCRRAELGQRGRPPTGAHPAGKRGTPMRAGVIAALAMMLCGPAPVSAQTAGTDALATRERDAVHLTDALRANDPKPTDTFDGAADSLRAGHDTVILSPGSNLTAL